MAGKNLIASVAQIESRIFLIRGQKVMLDSDLAELYGVETRRLNEQVNRNSERLAELAKSWCRDNDIEFQ